MATIRIEPKDKRNYGVTAYHLSKRCDRIEFLFDGVYLVMGKVGVLVDYIERDFDIKGHPDDLIVFFNENGGLDHFAEFSIIHDPEKILMGYNKGNTNETCYYNDNAESFFFAVEEEQGYLKKLNIEYSVLTKDKYIKTVGTDKGWINRRKYLNPEFIQISKIDSLESRISRSAIRLGKLTGKPDSMIFTHESYRYECDVSAFFKDYYKK